MESITTTCLIDLAFDLSVDWKTLARVLGLSEEVSRICDDYKRNVFEQAYRMLQTWKRRNGSQATYQALGEALSHDVVSRNDLAQKYCAGRNRSSLDEGIDLKGLKTGMVTIADMLSIANNFGKEWMWVGRLLGLEDSLLDGIKEDLSQTYECTYKMLEWWCKKKDSDATYECLARALLHRTVGMREVAEKFCVDHREKEIASAAPSGEGNTPIDKKLKNLTLNGSTACEFAGSYTKAPGATGNKSFQVTTPPRVPEPADDCITKNVITILPYKVWKELAIKLDPERPLGGDYKDLACEMGYTVEKILYFQSRNGPTEALLTDCANSISIDELCNKLEAIGRSDAKIVVDEWIKKKTTNV